MAKLNWSQAIIASQRANNAYALLSVLNVKGSSPRDQDAKMVVTNDEIWDTIGGGRLEHELVIRARELLAKQERTHELKDVILGPEMGQCCGGKLTVLIEIFPAEPFVLAVFGAGHIAQRLMPLVDELPGKKYWVDQRAEWINKLDLLNTEKVIDEDPIEFVNQLPKNFCALVFTHEHWLDFQLVEAMLRRDDGYYVGLIASKSKITRFRSSLLSDGITEQQMSKLISPVGLASVPGKLPAEVAVSIAAQLIQVRHQLLEQQPSVDLKLVNESHA